MGGLHFDILCPLSLHEQAIVGFLTIELCAVHGGPSKLGPYQVLKEIILFNG